MLTREEVYMTQKKKLVFLLENREGFQKSSLSQQVQTAQQIAAEEPLENDSGNELNLTDKPIAATEMN